MPVTSSSTERHGFALLVLAFLSVGLVIDANSALRSSRYGIVDLGTLGGSRSGATAVNERGDVVGWSLTPNGMVHAFLWQAGTMQDLGPLPGDSESCAFDVNEDGQVVGWSANADDTVRAVLWSAGRAFDLGTLGGANSVAYAVNNGLTLSPSERRSAGPRVARVESIDEDHLWVVGTAENAEGVMRPCVWTAARPDEPVAYDLQIPAGFPDHEGEAVDVNDNRQIAAWAEYSTSGLGNYPRAFLWNHGALRMYAFPGPSDWDTYAAGLNKRGDLAALTSAHSGAYLQFWPRNGRRRQLSRKVQSGYVGNINDRRQIVGAVSPTRGTTTRDHFAFLWERGRLRKLEQMTAVGAEWRLPDAMDINNRGQIVGTGFLHGKNRAYLLTPR